VSSDTVNVHEADLKTFVIGDVDADYTGHLFTPAIS
jgi:hypothetical protein